MCEVMHVCVIMHNMIIQSEYIEPLAVVDRLFPAYFANLLAMQKICDEVVHHKLQNGMVEHLWAIKRDTSSW
jgi:hypothetical protein